MTRSANQASEQLQSSAPRSVPTGASTEAAQEDKGTSRIPLVYRIVFLVWSVCFALLILVALSSDIRKFIIRLTM